MSGTPITVGQSQLMIGEMSLKFTTDTAVTVAMYAPIIRPR